MNFDHRAPRMHQWSRASDGVLTSYDSWLDTSRSKGILK